MTTSMFLFPLFSHIYVMYILIALAGLSSGCIDCIGNCWIIHIWGKENPPFMQIIHFMYGVGALIAPFLVEPFLLNKSADEIDIHSIANSTILSDVEGSGDYLMIHWPFIIGSSYCLLVLALVVINYILHPDNPVHPSRLRKNDDKDVVEKCGKKDKFQLDKPLTGNIKIIVIVVASLCMHAYVGKLSLSMKMSRHKKNHSATLKFDLHTTRSARRTGNIIRLPAHTVRCQIRLKSDQITRIIHYGQLLGHLHISAHFHSGPDRLSTS